MYHSMDAILSGMLLLGVAIFLLQTPYYESTPEQKNFIAQDMLSILSEFEISELDNSFTLPTGEGMLAIAKSNLNFVS